MSFEVTPSYNLHFMTHWTTLNVRACLWVCSLRIIPLIVYDDMRAVTEVPAAGISVRGDLAFRQQLRLPSQGQSSDD